MEQNIAETEKGYPRLTPRVPTVSFRKAGCFLFRFPGQFSESRVPLFRFPSRFPKSRMLLFRFPYSVSGKPDVFLLRLPCSGFPGLIPGKPERVFTCAVLALGFRKAGACFIRRPSRYRDTCRAASAVPSCICWYLHRLQHRFRHSKAGCRLYRQEPFQQRLQSSGSYRQC